MFSIDFFELSFLAEACIPKRPIARTMFWHRLIDDIYYELSDNERARLFEWITKNVCFDLKDEDSKLFYDRFNPDNQYEVSVNYKDVMSKQNCFLNYGRYRTSRNNSIVEDYITNIEKIKPIIK